MYSTVDSYPKEEKIIIPKSGNRYEETSVIGENLMFYHFVEKRNDQIFWGAITFNSLAIKTKLLKLRIHVYSKWMKTLSSSISTSYSAKISTVRYISVYIISWAEVVLPSGAFYCG